MSLIGLLETIALLLVCMVLPSALALYFSAPRESAGKPFDLDYR